MLLKLYKIPQVPWKASIVAHSSCTCAALPECLMQSASDALQLLYQPQSYMSLKALCNDRGASCASLLTLITMQMQCAS